MTAVADLRVDSTDLFDRLASRMADEAELFEHLGDIDMDLALVMTGPQSDFRIRLSFQGITCTGVAEIGEGEERQADCWLEGPMAEWLGMFEDIRAHGRATGGCTLNTLSVFGDRITLHSMDPMGEDRFHRFNQTLQEFFDGAASVAAPDGAPSRKEN